MTKQEIIEKKVRKWMEICEAEVMECMEEYKKQECIKLIEFMFSRATQTSSGHPASWIIDIATLVTNEELYLLFEEDNQ